MNLLDNAAQMGANPTPARKKPKPQPKPPPQSFAATRERPAPTPPRVSVPRALSPEDKRALLQVAMQDGGTHATVVARQAQQGGIGSVADWAWAQLASKARRGGLLWQRATEATTDTRGVWGTVLGGFGPGLGPLGAYAALHEPPTDEEIRRAARPTIRRVGPTQPPGAQAVMDSIKQELTARLQAQRASARGQAAPAKLPGRQLTSGDLRWLSQLTIRAEPGENAVGRAAGDLLRRPTGTATTSDLFDLAWRRLWRQHQQPDTY